MFESLLRATVGVVTLPLDADGYSSIKDNTKLKDS
jgi:hypothetical protein